MPVSALSVNDPADKRRAGMFALLPGKGTPLRGWGSLIESSQTMEWPLSQLQKSWSTAIS